MGAGVGMLCVVTVTAVEGVASGKKLYTVLKHAFEDIFCGIWVAFRCFFKTI